MAKLIRVALADDHPLFREGVARTVAASEDCEVVAECGDANGAVAVASELLPDILLLDVSMPGGGIEAARRVSASCPVVKILMLTVSESESDVMEALEAGACGYVLKGIGGNRLLEIIRSVHDGGSYVSPNLAARLLVEIKGRRQRQTPDAFADLTTREEQILKEVAQGFSNKEIAQTLELSEKTIKHYMTNILQKLQVRNRVEAALKAHVRYSPD